MARKNIDVNYVKKLKNGDANSFDEIYNFYKDSIYFFVFSLVKNKADAEDCAQEAFVKMLRDIKTLEKNKSFTSWLYMISYNIAMEHHRKKKDVILSEENEYLLDDIMEKDESSDIYNKKDVVNTVKLEIEKLPIKFIQVAQLHFLSGLSVREISTILSVPERTVRDRLARIKKTMKESLTNNGYTPRRYFSFAGIPLLFLVMKSIVDENKMSKDVSSKIHDEITSKSKNSFTATTVTTSSMIISGITSLKIIVAICSILILVSVGLLLNNQNTQENSAVVEEMMKKKHFSNMTYFETLSYDNTPTRDQIEVTVQLLKRAHSKDIHVLNNKSEIPFQVNDNTVTFKANENGVFHIKIAGEQITCDITNIDKHTPEITMVDYSKEYVQIYTVDEDHRYDFEKSYALFNGKRYKVTSEGKIIGNLDGEIKIYMFDRQGDTREYVVNHKQQDK